MKTSSYTKEVWYTRLENFGKMDSKVCILEQFFGLKTVKLVNNYAFFTYLLHCKLTIKLPGEKSQGGKLPPWNTSMGLFEIQLWFSISRFSVLWLAGPLIRKIWKIGMLLPKFDHNTEENSLAWDIFLRNQPNLL